MKKSLAKYLVTLEIVDWLYLEWHHPTQQDKLEHAEASQLYGDLDNADLWVGIIGDWVIPGSDLGEVGARLVAAQFRKIRNADRFWYERVMAPYPELLAEIKSTKLADVILRNTGVTTVNTKNFILVA